jgi:hypothetical protein
MAFTLHKFELFEALYNADVSKLSFLIIGVFALVTPYIGYLTYRLSKNLEVREWKVENCWFFANECQTLGLIGTVIGFLVMLGSAFVGLNVADVANVQHALETMALGMSSALLTTLVGMVCGVLLKLQLMNLHGKI